MLETQSRWRSRLQLGAHVLIIIIFVLLFLVVVVPPLYLSSLTLW